MQTVRIDRACMAIGTAMVSYGTGAMYVAATDRSWRLAAALAAIGFAYVVVGLILAPAKQE